MPTQGTCANCGAPLAGDARKGFCPKCLFTQAQSGLLDSTLSGDFGDYELREEIGRGGMGVVYRARQRSLDRVVAIKRMVFGPGSDPDLVKRFRAEAVSAAALLHPNIVAIHEVGVHEGQHFFVMDYVQGQSLAHLVTAGPLPARRAAGYLKTLAEAVHYAHERGILHRDLKPSNVLLDEQDQPRIVDFGLARRLEGASELTVTGQVLGSPQYLPPEQATAKHGRVSRRTDVYGLGATLYHLLTGRPPFQAESLAQTLDLVLHTEPIAPRLLNPSVPRDLETICLKCLEKEPAKRYPTAQMLAEELGRFLDGQPIQARPLGPVGKTWRWCRRKPQVASLAGVAVLAIVLGFAGVLWQWRQAEAQRQRAEAGELSYRQQAYISDINAAQAALKENNPGRALQALNRHRPTVESKVQSPKLKVDLRGFEWRYLWQQCQSEAEALIGGVSSRINSLEVSSDGRWLVAGSDAGAVKLWNLSTGEETVLAPDGGWPNYATFSMDSRLVLLSDQTLRSHGTIIAWDIPGRRRLAPIYQQAQPVGPMAFSGNGKWLGIGAIARKASAQAPDSLAAATALGGKKLVLLESPGWKKARELRLKTPNTYLNKGMDWVFTVDNRSVIFAETEPACQLCLYDFAAGSEPRYFPAHKEGITAMAISPDGRMLATGSGYSDNAIRLWEADSLRSLGELSRHTEWVTALKFSHDGQILASASADQTIRLWRVSTKEPSRIYRGLAAEISRVCFGRNDEKLFSGGIDGKVFCWPAVAQQAGSQTGFECIETGAAQAVTVSADCTRYAAIRQGNVYLGEVKPDTVPIALPDLGTNNNCLRFSSERHLLFSGTWNGMVRVWSLDEQRLQTTLHGVADPVCWLGQDMTGHVLVGVHWHLGAGFQTPARPHTVSVWNTANWRPQKAFTIPGVSASYAISPDGNWLAAGEHVVGNLQVWDLRDPAQTNTLAFPGNILSVTFSPDSMLLAAATEGGVIKVWPVPAFREPREFRAARGALLALTFSPDGRRLVTAGARAGSLQVWDLATWQHLITVDSNRGIDQLLFSAEGNQLAAQNSQGDALIWRVPSFAEIEAKEKTQRPQ